MTDAVLLILAGISATTSRVLGLILLSIVVGWFLSYYAIKSRLFENIFVAFVEVFESVPVISFFPIVLLVFVAGIGGPLGSELAVDFLVFTAVVWNIWIGEYQAFKTVPREMVEVSENYRLTFFEKLTRLYIPFSVPRIVANLFPSFSDGFFYITVSEAFSIGSKSYKVFGITSVISSYVIAGDWADVELALFLLSIVIVAIILLFREITKRSVAKYALDTDIPVIRRGRLNLLEATRRSGILSKNPLTKLANYNRQKKSRTAVDDYFEPEKKRRINYITAVIGLAILAVLVYGLYNIVSKVSYGTWMMLIGDTPGLLVDLLYDYLRVLIIVAVSMVFAIFVGYYFATNRTGEKIGLPAIQTFASYPTPIYFPFVFLATSVFVSSMFGYLTDEFFVLFLGFISTFYYVFYSFWMGVKAMPQEFTELMNNLDLNLFQKMRRVILPSAFPYLISGISATINSAWGGLMIGEYWPNIAGNKSLVVSHGLMKDIAVATASGNIALAAWASFIFGIIVVFYSIFFTKRMMDVSRKRYVAEEGIF